MATRPIVYVAYKDGSTSTIESLSLESKLQLVEVLERFIYQDVVNWQPNEYRNKTAKNLYLQGSLSVSKFLEMLKSR